MSATNDLHSRLAAGEVIIMDGGTGTEIQRRDVPMGPAAWSGEPMLTHPHVVRAIHEDYIRAGAEILITNTFSTSRSSLERAGLGDRTAEINGLAVRVAREARDSMPADRPVLIAGSMCTFLPHNDPTVTPSFEAALADYLEQSQLLAEAGVDLIVVEMLIRTLDARAAVEAATATGLPIWVGYSCVGHEGQQSLGVHGRWGSESIADAVDAVASRGASAIFIMHTTPEDTTQGLQELRHLTSLPIGAYAHSGALFELRRNPNAPHDFSKGLGAQDYLRHAQGWVGLGAQVIGGGCGTTPEYIRLLKENLPTKLPG